MIYRNKKGMPDVVSNEEMLDRRKRGRCCTCGLRTRSNNSLQHEGKHYPMCAPCFKVNI